MRLNEMQECFRDLMLQSPEALETPDSAFAALFPDDDIPLPERLKVYRNNIVGGITDALAATFPLLETLVGEEFLKGMARAFVLEHPPQTGCLNSYGAGFDAFIADFAPARKFPYLPDMARLELALNEAYYAPDDKPLAPETLAQAAPEKLADLKLSLRTSARLIESNYPLDKIRALCLSPEKENIPDLDTDGIKLLILRPALDVKLIPLQSDEYLALSFLQSGRAFGEMVEKTLAAFPAFDLPAFLQKHIAIETFKT